MTVADGGRTLFAVNAGSDSVSEFSVAPSGALKLLGTYRDRRGTAQRRRPRQRRLRPGSEHCHRLLALRRRPGPGRPAPAVGGHVGGGGGGRDAGRQRAAGDREGLQHARRVRAGPLRHPGRGFGERVGRPDAVRFRLRPQRDRRGVERRTRRRRRARPAGTRCGTARCTRPPPRCRTARPRRAGSPSVPTAGPPTSRTPGPAPCRPTRWAPTVAASARRDRRGPRRPRRRRGRVRRRAVDPGHQAKGRIDDVALGADGTPGAPSVVTSGIPASAAGLAAVTR